MTQFSILDDAVAKPGAQTAATQQPVDQTPAQPVPTDSSGQESAVAKTPEVEFNDTDLFGEGFDVEQFRHLALDANEPALEAVKAAQTKETQLPEGQQQVPPQKVDNDTTRYQYWQSQADRERNERLKIERELAELRELSPYAQIIRERPEVLAALSQAVQSAQQTELTPPQPPQKPLNYNPTDAYGDPESPSYRWREEMENSQVKQMEYINNQLSTIQQERYEQQQRALEIQRNQQAQQEWRQRLVGNYGFTPVEASQFVEEMYSPSSLNEQNLVKLFMLNHPEIIQSRRGQRGQSVNPVQQKAQTLSPTIANMPGAQPVQLNEHEEFSQGLMAGHKHVDY